MRAKYASMFELILRLTPIPTVTIPDVSIYASVSSPRVLSEVIQHQLQHQFRLRA